MRAHSQGGHRQRPSSSEGRKQHRSSSISSSSHGAPGVCVALPLLAFTCCLTARAHVHPLLPVADYPSSVPYSARTRRKVASSHFFFLLPVHIHTSPRQEPQRRARLKEEASANPTAVSLSLPPSLTNLVGPLPYFSPEAFLLAAAALSTLIDTRATRAA